MQRLYSAANLPEAHLVRGLLAAAGIEARVFNEFAGGALGELPFSEVVARIRETLRQVAVQKDLPEYIARIRREAEVEILKRSDEK